MKLRQNTVEDIVAQIELAKEQLRVIRETNEVQVKNIGFLEADEVVKAYNQRCKIHSLSDKLRSFLVKVEDYIESHRQKKITKIQDKKRIRMNALSSEKFNLVIETGKANSLLDSLEV